MGMYGIGPQVLEAAELREIAVNNARKSSKQNHTF